MTNDAAGVGKAMESLELRTKEGREFIFSLIGPAGKEFGLLLGDYLHLIRQKTLASVIARAKSKVDKVDVVPWRHILMLMKLKPLSFLMLTTLAMTMPILRAANRPESESNPSAVSPTAPGLNSEFTVVAYYYPGFHHDPRWDKAKYPGFTEWDLIKKAKPRFPGHNQPKVPLWGYADESDPRVMEQKIAVAADYGVNAFIFDWYYYDDGPYLNRALDEGFLQATNNSRLRFSLHVGQP